MKMLWVASALLLPAVSAAQELWQGAAYGDSVQTVAQAFPVAQRVEGESLASGARELLRIADFTLVGEPFDVSFFFKGERLEQVTISLDKGPTPHQGAQIFDSALTALRAKYGKEISLESKGGMMVQRSAEWIAGRANVGLTLISIRDLVILNIVYQVRLSVETDKL